MIQGLKKELLGLLLITHSSPPVPEKFTIAVHGTLSQSSKSTRKYGVMAKRPLRCFATTLVSGLFFYAPVYTLYVARVVEASIFVAKGQTKENLNCRVCGVNWSEIGEVLLPGVDFAGWEGIGKNVSEDGDVAMRNNN
ncbi:carboxyl-terminal domain (ctd) phosphatase-like2 [Striga asiatica]|uniref:Carboxyl-terminal domain (Ctd) phosphatase-like2 n=1 Tax=Striga asiatica TaxID=4170 RepID=A0A5A7QY36_STRAF|nr:carboxyl-terminal domain (ctd) phosphatase-like2 [Striga asiatica]